MENIKISNTNLKKAVANKKYLEFNIDSITLYNYGQNNSSQRVSRSNLNKLGLGGSISASNGYGISDAIMKIGSTSDYNIFIVYMEGYGHDSNGIDYTDSTTIGKQEQLNYQDIYIVAIEK